MSALLRILQRLFQSLLAQWPDLLGTFYGVLLGGLATFAVVRWQLGEERKTRRWEDRQFLGVLIEHVNGEISRNVRVVDDLIRAFGSSDRPRLEVWDWAVTIVMSFSNQAHDDLYRTGLQRHLPAYFDDAIREAHSTVFDVKNRVRQARAQHIFNSTYVEDGEVRNEALYEDVRRMLPGALESLREADETVDPANLPWNRPDVSRGEARKRWLRMNVKSLVPDFLRRD